MKIARISVSQLLVCVLSLGIFSTFSFADGPQWVEVRSSHFSVITDAGEKRGREVAMRFEQMRSVFGTLMTKAKISLPIPLQIVAFRTTKEFRQFAPLWHGKPTQLAGLFQPGEDRSFIMLDLSLDNPWSVVFHEYAHQLMNGNITQHTDPWFDEGFAEYFSTIEVDNKEARVGKPSEDAFQVLQQMGWMKVGDLFRVQHNSQSYNEGDRRTVFYAEANMMVHYLYDNQLVPKASIYFNLKTNNGLSVEDAIQQAFGMNAAGLNKALQDYVRAGRYKYYPIPMPKDIATIDYAVTPVSAMDSSAVLADIHLHSPDYQEKAITEFQDILKSDPNHAAALRGLGYAYLRKKQYDEAAKCFQRAAQLDSKDPRVHYYYARLMSREGSFADHSHLPEMVRELETAIALDPNFADPYMLLAFAQVYGGDPAKGLENMKKAISLSPRDETYQYDLAQIYLANRQFDEGLAILHGLAQTSNQDLASRVQQSIAQAEQIRALMAQREQQPGSVIVRRPAAAAPDDEENSASPETAHVDRAPVEPAEDSRPIKYIQGIIQSVDCSSPPSAVMTIATGAKIWKMTIADTDHMMLRGADRFSCSWRQQKAGINYRTSGDNTGDVVWVGLQ